MNKLLFLTATLIFISGCLNKSVDTSDPEKVYKYWTGELPPDNVKVLEGKYWRSSHWSYEFEVFLHLKADKDWKHKFVMQNNLSQISQHLELPPNVPAWFRPNERSILSTPNGAYTGPFYFEDTLSNDIFIYQIQL